MRDAADAGGRPRRYRVVEAERIEVDRETAFLRLLSYDPGYTEPKKSGKRTRAKKTKRLKAAAG